MGTPAAPNRSTTLFSTPQVMGLRKPSRGGGEYADEIRRKQLIVWGMYRRQVTLKTYQRVEATSESVLKHRPPASSKARTP